MIKLAKLVVLTLILIGFTKSESIAGYYTPGTGVHWNFDDLVANSGGIVTFGSGFYTVNDTIRVRKNDTLYISSDIIVKFALNKSLYSSGVFLVNPPTGTLFTALDTLNKWSGIKVDSNNTTVIRKLTMEYSIALRINDCSILVDSCIFQKNGFATTSLTNAVISPARTGSTITNCQFLNNYRACIQSGFNVNNPMKIIGNYFYGNDLLLINTPAINMSSTGTDTLFILNNQILHSSTNSGGISIFNSSPAIVVITGNKIIANRYGINVQGGNTMNVLISYNQIDSNNIQGNPNLGGSGIAFLGGTASSQQNTRVTGNIIRWNLWGITIQNRAKPTLGNVVDADTSNDGKNYFLNNTNGTTPYIDIYNNSVDSIYAQGNYFATNNLDSVAAKIFDFSDQGSLGPVYYKPIETNTVFSSSSYGNNGRTGSSLYYFANSLPGGGSPSQPSFSWRDTTGSTTLILNHLNVGTLGAGTVDDGRYDLTGALGGSVIRQFGNDYNDIYIGTNGIISFAAFDPVLYNTPPATGLPQALANSIFPLWMNFDYSSILGPPLNRLSYKVTATEVIVTYDNAYVSGGLPTDYVSFQIILQKVPAASQNSNIIVQYDNNASGASFISKYNSNSLPTHLVGLQGANNNYDYAAYRFSTGTSVVVPGPLFGSPLAVSFGPDNAALPVELASFTSTVNNSNVTLNWRTVSEINNSGFGIERRNEEGSWRNIGSINGNGTSTHENSYTFTDRNLSSGKYSYRLKQNDFNGNFRYYELSNEVIIGLPVKFSLSQNYPNPFNPVTKIDFELPVDAIVSIKIFDLTGREIASLVNEARTAGYYSESFNASSLSSGVYFYRLSAEGSSQKFDVTKKMTLIK
ncbi:hypothetical protein BH10BAC5_BH10BAC5_19640 [soil metagenome]